MKTFVLIILALNIYMLFLMYSQNKNIDDVYAQEVNANGKPLLQMVDASGNPIDRPEVRILQVDDKALSTVAVADNNESRQAVAAADEHQIKALQASSKPRNCILFGPFAEGFRADLVVDMLADANIAARKININTNGEKVPYSYRVFIPSLADFDAASQVAAKLSAASINDYYIITKKDDEQNGISLGVYTRKQGALERMAQINALGLQVPVKYYLREREQPMAAWVQYSSAINVPDKLLQNLKLQGVEPEMKPMPCQ